MRKQGARPRQEFGYCYLRRLWIDRAIMTALVSLFVICSESPSLAGSSWFSKVHQVEGNLSLQSATEAQAAATTSSLALFDVVVSLYNDPSGDGDPGTSTGSEQQTAYENIIRNWADAVCEQSNGAHKLGKVRLFTNGRESSRADVVWNASEQPRANPSGFGTPGFRIIFGDIFPEGCGTGCTKNMLTDPLGAGYTLGHEWGHYVYGLYDEYRGSNASVTKISLPQTGDTPVVPSIMSSQWNAKGGDFRWLNHSTSNNFQANTAQGRVFGVAGWDVLIRDPSADPRNGDRAALPQRTHYTTLDGRRPTASDNWVKIELPGFRTTCRNQLEIIWMQEDLEMQVVIDRSGSMAGTPMANAQQAAKSLVDVFPDGQTALGIVSFATDVTQDQSITSIPDPGNAVKATIKGIVDTLIADGSTSLFDAAQLALTNLQSFKTAHGTKAKQLVFLLSDGMDNDSLATQGSVTSAYQAADVPLVTFGYGSFAPTGVLQQLASDTGGSFFASPTTLAQIQNAFLAAISSVSSLVNVESGSIIAPSGGVATEESFQVDSTLASFSIFATYDGNIGDINFALEGPTGAISGIPFTCSTVAGTTSCLAQVPEGTVTALGHGAWSVEVANVTGTDIAVLLNIIADPLPKRTYDVTVAALGGNQVTYPAPIILTATISQGLPITGVNIVATVTDPSNTTVAIDLNDEGNNGDAQAGDGIYSAIIGYALDGIHTVKVTVDNSGLTARFTLDGFQPAHPAPDQNGRTPTPPPLPSINENFTRTAVTQVTVQGILTDDHPDTPPGTPLPADNRDILGSIDFAGDIDFFQIAGVNLATELVVRVSDFALGMDPILTVFKADGVTQVASADLTTAASESGYVLLTIPSVDLDPSGVMIAKVEHSNPAASQGTYVVSAGSRLRTESLGRAIQAAIRQLRVDTRVADILPVYKILLVIPTLDPALVVVKDGEAKLKAGNIRGARNSFRAARILIKNYIASLGGLKRIRRIRPEVADPLLAAATNIVALIDRLTTGLTS